MTRWPDYFFNIWPFSAMKIRPIKSQIAKEGAAFCQIRNNPFKNCQRLVNFCQSGKISPNLVTLDGGPLARSTLTKAVVYVRPSFGKSAAAAFDIEYVDNE